jgi:hypothetical protein
MRVRTLEFAVVGLGYWGPGLLDVPVDSADREAA